METDMPSSPREQFWEQRISRIVAQLSAQAQVKHEVFPPRSHSLVLVSESGIPRTYATVLNRPLPTQGGGQQFLGSNPMYKTTVEFSEAHSRRPHLRHTKHCSNRFWRGGGRLKGSGESAQLSLHSYFQFCKKSCGVTRSKCLLVNQQTFQNVERRGIRSWNPQWQHLGSRTPRYWHASGFRGLVRQGDQRFHAQ